MTKPHNFTSSTTTHTSNTFHFYISSALESETTQHDELLNTLNTASNNDSVIIHINCVGGDCATGIQILNAIKHSDAIVTTIVEGVAHSMATYIFLAGNIRKIRSNCLMLFHNYGLQAYGKGAELSGHVAATNRWMNELSDDYYTGFLTKKEIKSIKRDRDVWLTTKQVRKRLKQ